MSEKRLIDLEEIIRISYDTKNYGDMLKAFKKLPKPSLADVCGKRTLDSMTEEEAKEHYRRGVGLYIKSDIMKWAEAIKWFIEKGFNIFEVGE